MRRVCISGGNLAASTAIESVVRTLSWMLFRTSSIASATAPEIADYLHEQGYTHVLLHRQGMDFVLTETSDPVSEWTCCFS